MNGMILYLGRSGRSRQIAAELARRTGFEPVNLAFEPPLDFLRVNPVLLGSSVRHGRLLIAGWLARHWHELRGKKLVLYVVSRLDAEALEAVLARSLNPEMRLRVRVFQLSPAQTEAGIARLGRFLWPSRALNQISHIGQDQIAPLLAHLRELTRLQSRVSALQARGRRTLAST